MKNRGIFRDMIGGAIVFGFMGAMVALFKLPVPPENKDLIVFMLGQLSGFVGAVFGYHYHTSATSARKDSIIAASSNPADTLTLTDVAE